MTIITELEALAKAAAPGDWYFAGCNTVEVNHPVHGVYEIAHPCIIDGTARFIAKANPSTILALIALCKQQHEALSLVDEIADDYAVSRGMTVPMVEALTAFENFGKE